MSDKVKVKFYRKGRWAEHLVHMPQITIEKAGDIHDVSPQLADLVVSHKQGELVVDEKIEADPVTTPDPVPQTKEKRRKTGRRAKAEDDLDPLG